MHRKLLPAFSATPSPPGTGRQTRLHAKQPRCRMGVGNRTLVCVEKRDEKAGDVSRNCSPFPIIRMIRNANYPEFCGEWPVSLDGAAM